MQEHAQSRAHYGNLVAAIAAVACCDIATGLSLQLVPLLLESQGVAARVIGVNAAMGPVGILLAGPFLPRIIGHFGSKTVVFAAIAIIIACLAAFKLLPYLWTWFVIRFVLGIATGTLFTISEAWVLTFAGEKARGRIMGIYTSVLAITFSAGPLVLPLTGITGWLPWAIGMACVALSALPLALVKVDSVDFSQENKTGFFRFIARAPLLLAAVATVTMFDAVFISFFTIFGLRSGLPLAQASTMLGVAIVSNVALLTPLGMAADRWSRPGVMLISAIITVTLALSLPWVITTPIAWPVAMLMSATAFAPYIVALAMMGDAFKGPDLIAGTAAFAAMWGVGGLAGPPIAGAAIDAFGIDSLPVVIAAFHAILLLMLATSHGRLIRSTING